MAASPRTTASTPTRSHPCCAAVPFPTPTSTPAASEPPGTSCAAAPSSSGSAPSCSPHIQNTNTQYNLPAFEERIDKTQDRGAIIEHFDDNVIQMSMAADVALAEAYDQVIRDLELFLLHEVRKDHGHHFSLLRSIPGVGEILALTLLYEIDDLARFPRVQDFLSYARLVKGRHESAGKVTKSAGAKIGNAHLKWAFSEAAALFLRWNPGGRKYFTRIEKKHGKGKALSILAAKLGRAVYYMLQRKKPFDMKRFVTA